MAPGPLGEEGGSISGQHHLNGENCSRARRLQACTPDCGRASYGSLRGLAAARLSCGRARMRFGRQVATFHCHVGMPGGWPRLGMHDLPMCGAAGNAPVNIVGHVCSFC